MNYEFFDNQTVGSARDLASQLRGGGSPQPTRGAPLCSFKQISRQVAGFFDDENAVAIDANGTGVPTEVGVKLAIERGDTAPSYAAADSSGGRRRTSGTKQQTSANDAPLQTAESDPATTTEPGDDAPADDDTKDGLW